jgi:hypothetical protein
MLKFVRGQPTRFKLRVGQVGTVGKRNFLAVLASRRGGSGTNPREQVTQFPMNSE